MSTSTFSAGAYLDRRMPRIFLLGFISGFPWVLIGSALTLWLKEDGLSRSTIGWASLIFGVYAINFWWAPLIDRIRIPLLTRFLGHRKAWILTMQLIIILALVAWSTVNPVDNLAIVVGIGLAIAISSATQDITIDALRIEQINEHEKSAMAAGAAITVVGWWTGFKLGGMITLFTAEWLENAGYENYWQLTFLVLIVIIVACNIALMFVPEDLSNARENRQLADQERLENQLGMGTRGSGFNIVGWVVSTIVAPLSSFFRKNGVSVALAILAFIFLFKIGEAFMGKMSVVFYKELGFSKGDIAIYSKTLGWITTVVFTLIGGWFAITSGVVRALLISGIAMACTNLLFALLASIGTAGRTLLAASSGALVDGLDGNWSLFFILTTVMVIPSLVILLIIRNKLKLHDD